MRTEPCTQPRSAGHAAHEQNQDQGLRVRGVANNQLEVVRPDGFINNPGESGQCEDGEK